MLAIVPGFQNTIKPTSWFAHFQYVLGRAVFGIMQECITGCQVKGQVNMTLAKTHFWL